jgi:hypothetical protein
MSTSVAMSEERLSAPRLNNGFLGMAGDDNVGDETDHCIFDF